MLPCSHLGVILIGLEISEKHYAVGIVIEIRFVKIPLEVCARLFPHSYVFCR